MIKAKLHFQYCYEVRKATETEHNFPVPTFTLYILLGSWAWHYHNNYYHFHGKTQDRTICKPASHAIRASNGKKKKFLWNCKYKKNVFCLVHYGYVRFCCWNICRIMQSWLSTSLTSYRCLELNIHLQQLALSYILLHYCFFDSFIIFFPCLSRLTS